MKAVGYRHALPVDHPECLQDFEMPVPSAEGHDLLVEVCAVAVNPVDTKLRRNPANSSDVFKVLGFDAAGVVKAVGEKVTLFKPGDEVWYAGSIPRNGSNSEFQVVDERIVGRKPASLSFAQAAALPLTGMTAWELLFDRFGLHPDKHEHDASLLVVGAAGGVGSAMVQLAQLMPSVTVIGTASRPESVVWLQSLGVKHILDHRRDLHEELLKAGFHGLTHVASLTQTHVHYTSLINALLPQGKFGLIDDPAEPLDIMQMKRKSLSLHWEFMFTRPFFRTPDMIEQHHILTRMAQLVEEGRLTSTANTQLGVINAENLRKAHALQESGTAIGKIVLEGF